MKNLNLIKRLWTDSYEKQKVRGMQKYCILLLLLFTCVTHAWADNFPSDGVLFLKVNSKWKNSTPRFAVYFFNNSTSSNTWVSMTQVGSTDYYYAAVPSGTWPNCIFCRMNGDGSHNDNTWGNKWNQTSDLSASSGKNCFSIGSTSWDGDNDTNWGTYKPSSAASVSASSESITTAETSTLTTSITNTAYNVKGSTSYSVTTNPGSAGSVTSGGVFSATAAGTYTVTATVTYYPKGYSSLTSTDTKTKNITVTAAVSNTLTVRTDGHGSITTPAGGTAVYTIGTPVSIVAADGDGYTFKNWTVESGTATIASSTSKSTTVTVTAGTSATVQANYTENMTTVTINVNPSGTGTLTVGGSSFTPGNTTTAGISTSRSVVATAEDGYIFSSWGVTGNATGTSDDNTYTLKGNGSGSTGTLTANFTAKTLVRLYTSNPDDWSTVYAYVWYKDHDGDKDGKNAAWPGVDITSNTIDRNGTTYYYFEYYKENYPNWNRVIFHNNSGNQTNDITFSNTTNNGQYNDAGKNEVGSWNALPAAETTYGITCYAGANGSITARGTNISAGSNATVQVGATSRSLSAEPSPGYHFAGWTKAGSVTIADASSASTTMTATGTGTVTATWASNTVYFVNSQGWTTVKIHGWTGSGDIYGSWPGTAMTDAGFDVTIDGRTYDVYKKDAVPAGAGIIFNNGEADKSNYKQQTADLSADDAIGKYFYADECFTNASAATFVKPDGTYYASTSAVEAAGIECYKDHRVTFGVVGSTGGTIAGRNTTTSSNISSGAIVGLTNAISLTASPTSGYAIEGWYSDAAGNSLINHDNTAFTKTFSSSDGDLSAYVKFEALHTITLSATNGKIQIGGRDTTSAAVASNTTATITAVANPGYYFTGWTVPSGVTNKTGSSSASTIEICTTSDSKIVTANFSPIWRVACSVDSHNTENHKITTITTSAGAMTSGSVTIDLNANTDLNLKIYNKQTDKWWGHSGDVTKITYANKATAQSLAENTGSNQTFRTAGKGTYTFTWDVTNSKISIGYPTSYTVTFGYGTGGSAVTATVEDATAITSGQYAASGKDVTFTQTPATGYTFKGWYTTADGSTTVTNMAIDDAVLDDISANATVYAQYTPKTYAVTFDYDDNGGSKTSGEDSYDATFDLATITTPVVYKDGYCLDGWYSAASDGVKVIDKDGNLQPNVSVSATTWTDGDGKWKKDGTATVYAQYSIPTIVMTPSPAVLNVKKPEKDTVVIHQTFSCTPTGTYNVVYTVGYSANHTQLPSQPTIIYGTVAPGYDTIVMPMSSANTYEIVAELRTGSTPGSGTLLKRDTINYAVEDQYTVTLNYMVDGVKIRESREVYAYPSSTEIASEVRAFINENGYELDHWQMGPGIDSISGRGSIIDGGSAGNLQSKYIYARNNGNIYLHYKPKTNTVYFFNTFEMYWYSTIMKKYDYGTSTSYWANTYGAGSKTGPSAGQITPDDITMTTLSLKEKRWMAPIGASTTNFAFVSKAEDQEHFWGAVAGNEYPHVIYRTDYNAATPMFVPVTKDVHSDYYILNQNDGGEAHYYRGFWVKYSPNPDSTGYYLHVYNQKAQSGAKLIQTLPLRLSQTGEGGTWELRATMDLEGGKTYGFKVTKATGASTKTWYSYNGTLTAADHEGKVLDGTSDNIGLTTTSAGDYTFHVFCKDFGTIAANNATANQVQGQLAVTVDYATVSGDYRVIYKDATQTEWIASPSIHSLANGQDTVSFFIRKNAASRVMKIQKFDSDWEDFGPAIDLSAAPFSIAKDSVYVIYLQQNEDGTSISATGCGFYDGDYYIRTDCVDEHKWDYKQSLDNHRMSPSDYGMADIQPDKFTHYYVHWIGKGGNVKFIVANKYAPCLSDTVITDTYANVSGGNLPSSHGANVRFMYNKGTNVALRAYLYGSEEGDPDYLKITTSTSMMGTTATPPGVITEKTFNDEKNWVYQAEIKAKPGLTAKLTAEYDGKTQYFIGSADKEESIIGGTGDAWQQILLTYDFKVNRLICAWQPSGDSINGDVPINADIMIIRVGQEDAQQIIFKNNDSKLSAVKYIYSVMQFNRDDMVGMMPRWDYWSYQHCMYYISFPYDVLVNDIMAPGRMGTEWRIQRYNGAKRAKGWFAGDGVTTFWEDVQAGDTLKAYEGYSLLLNRRIFNDGSSTVWQNKGAGTKLYMYFPSKDATTGVVANKTVNVTVPSHECTLDRVFDQDLGKPTYEQRNHKIVDSHWNMIGTPLFEDKVASTITAGPTIESETLQYIYEWNPAGNVLGIKNTLTTGFKFRTMYSYMAQYTGTITFVGSAVNKIVAATRDEERKNYNINLELSKDEMFIGRTYVELRENAVDSFLLNEDVYMVKNGVSADLYTYAGAYEAGANVLTIDDHIVPVGVDVKTPGTYVFSMPDNFDGEVVLVDNYEQTRTNLMLEDYEIALPKGTISDRFYLEIKVNKVPTAIDGVSGGSLEDGKAHKYIENGIMYILQNGVIYDAQGRKIK